MAVELIFFFVSLLAAVLTCHFIAILRTSGIRDRRMRGFAALCAVVSGWIIMCAVTAIADATVFFPALYTAKVFFVVIVPYLSFWFVLNFIESRSVESRLLQAALIAIPALDIMALLTNPLHKLYFLNYENLPPPQGPLFFSLHLAPQLCGIFIAYSLLLLYIIRNYRRRLIIVFAGIGTLIPFALNLVYTFRLFGVVYDFSSLGFFLTVVLFVYAALSSRLRNSKPGLLGNTLAKIAKSPEISDGTIEDAARLISREGCLALGVYRVGLWRFDELALSIKSIVSFEIVTGEHFVQNDIDLRGLPQYKELLQKERMIVINDMRKPNAFSAITESYGPEICSMMDAPIWIRGELAGVVCVEQNQCNAFPERREWNIEEQSFASSLADFMAIAMTNAERGVLVRQLEAGLSEAEKLTRAVINTSPSAYILFDDELNLIDCNETLLRLFSCPDKQYLLDNYWELFTPKKQPDGQDSFKKAKEFNLKVLADGNCVYEWLHTSLDGKPLPMESTLNKIFYNGKIYVISYKYDLRHVKKMEKALVEAEKYAKLMLDAGPLCCLLWDNKFSIIDCNEAAVKLFGFKNKQEFMDGWMKDCDPEFQPDGMKSEEKTVFLEKAFKEGRCVFEWMHQALDGTPIPAEITLVRVKTSDDYVVAGYTRDLREVKKLEEKVKEIYHDPLTGLFNRRYLDENLEPLIKFHSRSGGMLSILMIDIDYFKKYNDTYGHTAGDNCLKAVADAMSESVTRNDDFIVRYGGEEFIAVLPNTDENGARLIAEEMLERIRSRNIPHRSSDIADHVTFSIGVTTGKADHTQNSEDYLKRADEMMYLSKQNGRNRSTFSALLPDASFVSGTIAGDA